MTYRTNEVSAEAGETGRHAADVRDNILALVGAVEDLRHAVIRVVRTTTAEVDRRAAPRHRVDLPCQVTIDGRIHAGRIADLSEGGACLRDVPTFATGSSGSLRIDRLGHPLPFVVRLGEPNALHLAFEPGAAAALRGFLEQLTERDAA